MEHILNNTLETIYSVKQNQASTMSEQAKIRKKL